MLAVNDHTANQRVRRNETRATTAFANRKAQAEEGWAKAIAWFKANGV